MIRMQKILLLLILLKKEKKKKWENITAKYMILLHGWKQNDV